MEWTVGWGSVAWLYWNVPVALHPLNHSEFVTLPELQYSPFAAAFFAATVLNASLALFALLYGRRRGFDGTIVAFTGILVSGTIWTLMRTIQMSTPDLAIKHATAGLMYLGLGGTIVSGLCFCLAYTGRDRYLTWRNVALLSIVPSIAAGLALSNPAHELLWTTTVLETGQVVYIDRSFQPVFYWYLAYIYLVLLVGAALVVRMVVATQGLYRRQAVAALLGIVAPMTTALLFSFDVVPLLPGHVDPTPLGFVVMVVLFGYSTFRYRLLDLVPVARETVVEEIDDVIVTIDPNDRVVDCNATARALLDIETGYVGVPASDLFDRLSADLMKYVDPDGPTEGEITVRVDGENRHYSVSASPVDGSPNDDTARVLVMRDVTSIKRREEELDLLRQVQSRVLRHNIRNELTTVRGNAELLAGSAPQQYTDRAEAIIEASDSLLSTTQKARLVEDIVDHNREVIQQDLRTVVDDVVAVVRQRYRNAEITVDGPERVPVRASPKLDAAVRNLIENACQHSDSDRPHVRVTIENTAEPCLLVSDNGPGIPDQEIQALEDGTETQLTHGSGIGLWYSKLVVERSDAELAFETGPDGTDVHIWFESADAQEPDGRATDDRSSVSGSGTSVSESAPRQSPGSADR